jgi:hypothetical protein
MPNVGEDRNSTIETLATRSGGLFIWAATACRFLGGYMPKRKLELLLSGPNSNLDQLYTVALQNSAPWTDGDFSTDACAVLGALVLSREPLTDKTIDSLLGLEQEVSSEVLKHLGCVVQWVPGQTARILHASFSDYLIDFDRSGSHSWFVEEKMQSRSLALGCFHVLHDRLRFNICGLKNSHLLNSEVLDLPERKKQCLSPDLSYASRFWANHLHNSGSDDEICAKLRNFMKTSFLYWLEVLSLLEQPSIASETLELARKYAQVSGRHDYWLILIPNGRLAK